MMVADERVTMAATAALASILDHFTKAIWSEALRLFMANNRVTKAAKAALASILDNLTQLKPGESPSLFQ